LKEEIEMSQRNRIVLAALALTAAFVLAPAPAPAAGLPLWRIPAVDALERAWTWMARLVLVEPKKPVAMQDKEGGAINPDGSTTTHLAAPPSPATPSGIGGGGK
jgi:hypothetical protein